MLKFCKYQGLGNDFIIIEGNQQNLPEIGSKEGRRFVRKACDRRYGIGADGLILVQPAKSNADIRMQIINSDGSEAEMCGNGVRCLVKYLVDTNQIKRDEELTVETLAGSIKTCITEDELISVDMGHPTFVPVKIPTILPIGTSGVPQGIINVDGIPLDIRAAGMGNPHMIIYVQNVKEVPLHNWGKRLENDKHFPASTNVSVQEGLIPITSENSKFSPLGINALCPPERLSIPTT